MSDLVDDLAAEDGSDPLGDWLIKVPGIKNLRDVGGMTTSDGHRVATGVVFRSAQLGDKDPATLAGLAGLGIETVFDLRTLDETKLLPDVVPDGVEVIHLDVLAEMTESIAAGLEDLFNDPAGANRLLADGSIKGHYLNSYRELVRLDSARDSYRTLFTEMASGKVSLFHCTAGKDRTGWAAASLQLLLNVPFEVVSSHYLASNKPVLELFRPILDSFAEAGGDARLLSPIFEVDVDYLSSAVTEMTELFGGIDGYFQDGLGLDREVIDTIRRNLLVLN